MQVKELRDMVRGWYVGDFEPNIYRTKDFEVGVMTHRKGSEWPAHYHTAVEINLLMDGRMRVCDQIVVAGQLFRIEPGEVAAPEFLEDCTVVVVKTPSTPGDKFIVDNP